MAAIARPNGPVITEESGFAAAWPRAAADVVAWLERRGVARDVAEDAVQEAGVRAVTVGLSCRDAEDLRRWLRVVAWRVVVDRWRREARCVRVADVEATERARSRRTSPLEDEVSGRMELEAALVAFRRLSPGDREAIVAPPATGADRQAQVRSAVRRHRARSRLVAIMKGLAAAAGVVAWVPRRQKAAPGLAVALAGAVVVAVGPWVRPPVPDDGPRPPAHEVAPPPPGASATAASSGPAAPAPAVESEAAAPAAPAAGDGPGKAEARAASAPGPHLQAQLPGLPGEQRGGIVEGKEPGEPLVCAWLKPVDTRYCTPPTPAIGDPLEAITG